MKTIDQAQKLRELVMERKSQEEKPSSCQIITVTSGKGGVGKTNLAANLAISFATMGKRVLVLDADLGLSNLNIILGIVPAPKYNIYHLIAGEKSIADVMVNGPCGIKLISGALGITKLTNLSHKNKQNLINSFTELDGLIDIIIIDTSAGLSAPVLLFILAADQVVLITTPEPTAIIDAYGIMKAVAFKSIDVDIKLVINRITNITEGKKSADRMVEIVSQFLGMHIETIGYIFEDSCVSKSVMTQLPFFLAYPKSKATECIYHIRNRLANIPEPGEYEGGVPKFFKRLFGIAEEEKRDFGLLV